MSGALFHQFRELHARLGIDTQKLGCIMLDVEPIDLGDALDPDWLYYSPTMPYCQGQPSEAHVTLLYGLLRPGPEMRAEVDEVLAGWKPTDVRTKTIHVFPSVNGEPYSCIVLKLAPTRDLMEAHARLSLLPHIDTFWDYRPHVTLAYVKAEHEADALAAIRRKLGTRDTYTFVPLAPIGINYGGDK